MCSPWWGEGIPGRENQAKESMCSGDNEKLSVAEDKLDQKSLETFTGTRL